MAETVKYIIDADISDFITAMTGASAAAALADKRLNKSFKNMDKATKEFHGSFKKGFDAFDAKLDRSTDLVRDFGVVMRSVNTTSLILGVTAASGAILSLGFAAARTAGLLYTLPAALGGVGAILATFAVGFAGIGNAVGALDKANQGAAGSAKELRKELSGFDKMNVLQPKETDDGGAAAANLANAMDKLSPAGQAVAQALYEIGQSFRENIGKPVQEVLLNGVAPALLQTYAILEGPLKTALIDVAGAANLLLLEMLRVMRMPFFSEFLVQAGALGAFILTTLTPAIEPLARAFVAIFQVGTPYVMRFTEVLSDAIIKWSNWADSIAGRNAIKESIDDAIVAVRMLGGLLGSVFGVFRAISDAAGDAIYIPIQAMTELINSFETWLRTAEGIRTVNSLFEISGNAIKAFGSVLAGIGSVFADVVNWFASLDESTQQTIIKVGIMAAAFGGLLTYFTGLISPIISVASGLLVFGKSVGGAASLMSGLGGATGLLRVGLGALLGPVGLVIAALSLIFTQSEAFREAIGNLVSNALPIAIGMFKTVFAAISPLMSIIGSLASVIGSVLAVAINILMPLLTGLMNLQLMPLRILLGILTPVLEGVAQALGAVSDAAETVSGVINTVVGVFGSGKTATDNLKTSTDAVKSAQDKYNDSVKKSIDLSKEIQGLQASQVDNQLAVMDSQDRVTEKQNAYNTAVATHGTNSREAQRASLELTSAQNNLKDAEQRVIETNDTLKTKNNELSETQKTTAHEARQLKDANLQLKTAQEGAGGAAEALRNTLKNTIKSGINEVIGMFNRFSIPPITVLGKQVSPKIDFPDIPMLARGGIVNSPTFAMVGESGKEAVMPLENNTEWIDKLASKINSSNGKSGGQPLNLTVQIGEDKIASTIIELINEKTLMSGRNMIMV